MLYLITTIGRRMFVPRVHLLLPPFLAILKLQRTRLDAVGVVVAEEAGGIGFGGITLQDLRTRTGDCECLKRRERGEEEEDENRGTSRTINSPEKEDENRGSRHYGTEEPFEYPNRTSSSSSLSSKIEQVPELGFRIELDWTAGEDEDQVALRLQSQLMVALPLPQDSVVLELKEEGEGNVAVDMKVVRRREPLRAVTMSKSPGSGQQTNGIGVLTRLMRSNLFFLRSPAFLELKLSPLETEKLESVSGIIVVIP